MRGGRATRDRLPAAKPASCAAPMVRTSRTRKWPLAPCGCGRSTRPVGRDSFFIALVFCGSLHLRMIATNAVPCQCCAKPASRMRNYPDAKSDKRWPQMNVEDVRWAIYESESGFLTARTACQAVVEGFQAEGGEYKQIAVSPRDLEAGIRDGLLLSDGSRLAADQFVFACGPWLSQTLSGNYRRPHSAHEAGCFFLWRTRRRRSLCGTEAASLGRQSRPLHLWHPGRRRTWIQGCRRHARPGVRSDFRRTSSERSRTKDDSRLPRLPLSGDERRAVD